jgi:hypothetical protein
MAETTTTATFPSFSGYQTELPNVETTTFGATTTTATATSTPASLTAVESSTISTALTNSSASRTLNPTSISIIPSPSSDASYAQIVNPGKVGYISWAGLNDANFEALCPSGDCVRDCQNYPRLFEEVPSLIPDSFQTYGKSINNQTGFPNTTLFGVCSNLDNIYDAISTQVVNDAVGAYFPQSSRNGIVQVSSSLATCLTSTCDASREPQNCIAACNMTLLYSTGATTNLTAVAGCLKLLCGNTCGLPYANQDIMGVGVLASYVIQAVLIILCAVAIIGYGAYLAFSRKEKTSSLKNFRKGVEGFLAAQCYFTIALEIAALGLAPWRTDPLTGYALFSVAITGFLCPVFTLMLLHSRGWRSTYGLGLTALSYTLSTIVFWSLYANLSRHSGSTTGSDEALRRLYQIPTCGGSSAIALCPQTIGNDPLEYLAGFYNSGDIPNLHTMPLLWGWTTFILLLLLVNQSRHALGVRHAHSKFLTTWQILGRILSHWGTLPLACTLFVLCLAYQAEMLRKYSRSDVIDWNGWTFGQVVAVVIWVQPIADYLHVLFRESIHLFGTG